MLEMGLLVRPITVPAAAVADGGAIYNAAGAHLILIRSSVDSNVLAVMVAIAPAHNAQVVMLEFGAGIYNAGSLQVDKKLVLLQRNRLGGHLFWLDLWSCYQ